MQYLKTFKIAPAISQIFLTKGYFKSFEILQGLKSKFFLQGLFSKQGIIAGIKNIFKPYIINYMISIRLFKAN
jgi:ribosomal protein S8